MTTWRRLEGTNVDPELTEGLSARIADPLWLLSRQWQVGEFHGEDAASPIFVQAAVEAIPLTGVRIGRTTAPIAPRVPLEAIVEAEDVARGPARLRLQIEAAEALLTTLRRRGHDDAVDALRRAYTPQRGVLAALDDLDDLDEVGAARLRLLVPRVFHTPGLLQDWTDAKEDARNVDALRGVDDLDAVAAAIDGWATRERELFESPVADGAWVEDRLEYRFKVTASSDTKKVVLGAEEYPGGTLDWFHFDIDEMTMKRGGDKTVIRHEVEVLASPLQYAGQPASRFWEFEDGDVSYGDLAGGPEDLARSVIGAYAAVAGDDWLLVPVTLPVGTLSRVTGVQVWDNFTRKPHEVRSTAVLDAEATAAGTGPEGRPWRFFELTGDRGPVGKTLNPPMLFLPPVMDTVEVGRPLEAVEFRRDEMANMAWGIERLVESAWGRPVDRDTTIAPPRPRTSDRWDYTFMTEVPESWVPLVPVQRKNSRPQMVLRRGSIAHARDEGPATVPRGVLLDPSSVFVLQEEEIPNGGLRVTRRFQMARDHDGGVHLWVGRKKAPSSGPMRRTPLRFDRLRYEPLTPPGE